MHLGNKLLGKELHLPCFPDAKAGRERNRALAQGLLVTGRAGTGTWSQSGHYVPNRLLVSCAAGVYGGCVPPFRSYEESQHCHRAVSKQVSSKSQKGLETPKQTVPVLSSRSWDSLRRPSTRILGEGYKVTLTYMSETTGAASIPYSPEFSSLFLRASAEQEPRAHS